MRASKVLIACLALWMAPGAPGAQELPALDFGGYRVVVSRGNAFGIVSLQAGTDRVEFASGRKWPVADWEWFWLSVYGETAKSDDPDDVLKLVLPRWDEPRITDDGQAVWLHFERHDALRDGVRLTVDFRFQRWEPVFEVTYGIHNGSRQTLVRPYAMLGFPGFSDPESVTHVATATGARAPLAPHDNFLKEVLDDGRDQYLLIRDDVPAGALRPFVGSVSVPGPSGLYTLTSTFIPGPGIFDVYSAHTNKPRYLTSHLYVFYHSLPVDRSVEVTIRHELSGPGVDTGGPTALRPISWTGVKLLSWEGSADGASRAGHGD